LFAHPVILERGVYTYSISNKFVFDGGKWNEIGIELFLSKTSKNGSMLLKSKYNGEWVASYFVINTKKISYDYAYLIIGYTDADKLFYNASVNFKGEFFPIGMSYDVFGGVKFFSINDDFKRESVQFDQVSFVRESVKNGQLELSPWKADKSLQANEKKLEDLVIKSVSGSSDEIWHIDSINIVSFDNGAGWILVFNCVGEKDNVTRVYTDFEGRKIVKEKR
jgi:hypothetical protein